MKKFLATAVLCALLVGVTTGCVDKVEMQGTDMRTIDTMKDEESWQAVDTVASTIEGYRLVAGSLKSIDKGSFEMTTADGHTLNFKLAPETLLYTGSEKQLMPGDDITVVFEGELAGTDTNQVSVIAVSDSVIEGKIK